MGLHLLFHVQFLASNIRHVKKLKRHLFVFNFYGSGLEYRGLP